MKQIFSIFLLFCCCLSANAQYTLDIEVVNPSNKSKFDQPVVVSLNEFSNINSALVTFNGEEIPCQLDDINLDETFDELCFLVNLKGKERKTYQVTLSQEGEPRIYPARVFAEMLIRNDKVKEKNKHNNFISSITARGDCDNPYNILHHHGVDFESELNGIRIYFDKRQTLDLYGKYHKRLELKETQFYTSPEQKAKEYGDDILWVGNTFGLGAFRGWNGESSTMVEPIKNRTQRIIAYGPLRTIVEIIDQGWEPPMQNVSNLTSSNTKKPTLNMTIRYTQYAGHRDTDVDITFNKDVSNYQFSTGLIDIKGSEEFSDKKGLRGCWGTDFPAGDTINWKRETVGLGIYIPQDNIVKEIPANSNRDEQGNDYTFVIKTSNNKQAKTTGKSLSYKVAYCSDNEDFGMHTSKEWFKWLQEWKKDITTPIIIHLDKKSKKASK